MPKKLFSKLRIKFCAAVSVSFTKPISPVYVECADAKSLLVVDPDALAESSLNDTVVPDDVLKQHSIVWKQLAGSNVTVSSFKPSW